ncbi:DUF6951 family protein [Alkalibacter mobilis]|uniref:DUF6951 family protein n=1 Tax=Alkalibacter mobilis TaxID=2787712 RepID=UPI00189EA3DA|nr:hypothetical protein [Alkalibacter mobilis]MBF7095614.1 hypothetical protein [Alkalibacter mobilis]
MATVYVKPGACGLNSVITVKRKKSEESDYLVEIHIESESDNIKRLAKVLTEVDGMEESFKNFATSEVYRLGAKSGLHLACPVPSGIIKAIEVECGLALPRDVEIKVVRD